ncbi:HET-domain-containing protein, partial [Tothia fuscella]
YLTLSYCWGKKPVLTLKSENYSQFKDKIPVHLLPKTIQDAITITDALGFRHLWVDSCCIIQDSGIDWLTQAGEMAKIYTKSFLNLAATWAKESSDGVFHEMNPCSLSTIPIYRPQNTWTLQESMLSDRTVQFARNGIYWECKSSMTSDIGHDSVHDTQRDLNELEVRWFQWNTLIAEYSKRGLTNKGDKLVAMAGLARHFAHIANFHEEDYVSGLWKPTFPYSLLWRVAEGEAINSPQYGAPSWSWASVTGEI